MVTTTARDADGRKLSPGEAWLTELLSFNADDKYFCYLNDIGTRVVTFEGKYLGTVTQRRVYKRNLSWLSNEFWYIRVRDTFGQEWYGTSPGRGLYCKLRRCKTRRRKARSK